MHPARENREIDFSDRHEVDSEARELPAKSYNDKN